MKKIAILLIPALLSACATQRYGRAMPVSEEELSEMSCKQLRIEQAKAEEFLHDVRMQRADTNGAHVLGFLGDFGIGNVLEGDAAELSGEKRLKELRAAAARKGC